MVLAAASSSSVAELSSSHSVTSSRFNSRAVRSERGPERSQLSFSICSFRANDHHRPFRRSVAARLFAAVRCYSIAHGAGLSGPVLPIVIAEDRRSRKPKRG
jgi:hypothetical protein